MNNKTYGYVRVSTRDQNEARQLLAMKEFGVPESCMEKRVQFKSGFIHPGQSVFFLNFNIFRYGEAACRFHHRSPVYYRIGTICLDPLFPCFCQAHQRSVPETEIHLGNGFRFWLAIQINKQRVCDTASAVQFLFTENTMQGSPV